MIADDDASVVTADAALEDKEPALAALAAASVAGTVPAGPALRRQDPIKLRSTPELAHTKGLCAAEHGVVERRELPAQARGLGAFACATSWRVPASSAASESCSRCSGSCWKR